MPTIYKLGTFTLADMIPSHDEENDLFNKNNK